MKQMNIVIISKTFIRTQKIYFDQRVCNKRDKHKLSIEWPFFSEILLENIMDLIQV